MKRWLAPWACHQARRVLGGFSVLLCCASAPFLCPVSHRHGDDLQYAPCSTPVKQLLDSYVFPPCPALQDRGVKAVSDMAANCLACVDHVVILCLDPTCHVAQLAHILPVS